MRSFPWAIGVLVVSFTALAQAEEPRHLFRAGLLYSVTDGKQRAPVDRKVDSAPGAFLAYEVRVSDLLGVGIGLGYVKYELEFPSGSGRRDVNSYTLTTTLAFHPLGRGRFDWSIGPTLFVANYSGDPGESSNTNWDEDYGGGVTTAVDIGLGERSALNLTLEYLETSLEEKSRFGRYGANVPLDPFNLKIAYTIRF